MSVALSQFYEPVRALVGDDDPDFQVISDAAIDSRLRLVVNSGKVHGYAIGSDNESIIPSTTRPRGRGYAWESDSYDTMYGYMRNLTYGVPYDYWWSQSYLYFLNLPTQTICVPNDEDLTPANAPRAWTRLVYECANLFSLVITDFHFRTRSVTETIAAPKELVRWLEGELYSLVNGGAAGPRPPPLPLVALGVRSFMSGLFLDGSMTFGSYGWANAIISLTLMLCIPGLLA